MKIFFDFDGTLVDVAPRHYQVYQEVMHHFGGAPIDRETYWELKRRKTKWPAILEQSGLHPELENDFLKLFIQIIEQTEYLKLDQLFSGVKDVLESVSKENECYLVSLRRNPENLLAEIEWLNITQFFKKILTGHSETDGYDKKIELIKAELTGNNQGIIIGDTEADIVTGKELGLTTIAVLSGIREADFLRKLSPDYLVDSTTSLKEILLRKK